MGSGIYLGVDQIGAINSKGVPKPLPACLIRGTSVNFIYLKCFNKSEILKVIKPKAKDNLFICVDCVLGLPAELNISWRDAVLKIKKTDYYGMQSARTYFAKIGKGKITRRKIEIECNANSVFKEKPFQKNIQTGTFRIWKDLSLNIDNFYVPAFESKIIDSQIPLFEGYPSLSWKILFGSKIRTPEKLHQLIIENNINVKWNNKLQSIVNRDHNLADAFVLALTMKKYKHFNKNHNVYPEGWILGHKSKN